MANLPKKPAEMKESEVSEFYASVAGILRKARTNTYRAVNFIMVEAYWNVGRVIVEEEQQGSDRAKYGSQLIKGLASRLSNEFGETVSERNLRNFRQFYLCFPIWNAVRSKSLNPPSSANSEIRHALRSELTWTHYRALMRVENPEARNWYMNEAAEQNWSTRALDRQIKSLYYERMLMSRDKAPVVEEMRTQTAPLAATPKDFIKDPYVLEFLGLQDNPGFREAELETAIIGKLQAFMLELGKGFAFVARQQRISTESKDFFVDLVFYNYILKCFVLIDLKCGELTHQDIGQMDMYVRLYEDRVKGEGDNPTVGIILCTEKDHTVVKYSVLNESRQLFTSKYRLYLPSEEELRAEIEREREMAVRERMEMYGVEEAL
jgi:predicted nuclease of restriction endonuclease-like (RecB) superfamily